MIKDFINKQVTGEIDIEIINEKTGEVVTKDKTKNAITLTGIQYLTLLANVAGASLFRPFGALNLVNDTKKQMTKNSNLIAGDLRGVAFTYNPTIPAGLQRGYTVKQHGSLRNGRYVLSVAFPSSTEIPNFNSVCLSCCSGDDLTTAARYAAPFVFHTVANAICIDGPKNKDYIYVIKTGSIDKVHFNIDKTANPVFTTTIEDSYPYSIPTEYLYNLQSARWSDYHNCFIIPAYHTTQYTGFLYLYLDGSYKFVSTFWWNYDVDGQQWLYGSRGLHNNCTFVVDGNYAYCPVIRHKFDINSDNTSNRNNAVVYYTLGKFNLTTGELAEVLVVDGFHGQVVSQYYTGLGRNDAALSQVGPNYVLITGDNNRAIRVNINNFTYEEVTGQYTLNNHYFCHLLKSMGINIYSHANGLLFVPWVPSTVSYFINPTTNTVQTHNKPAGYSMKINYTFYIKDATLKSSQSIPDDTISPLAIQDLFYNACSGHGGVVIDPFCTAYVKNYETGQADMFGGDFVGIADSSVAAAVSGKETMMGVRVANNNYCGFSGEDLILKRTWFFDYPAANGPATHIVTGCKSSFTNLKDYTQIGVDPIRVEDITVSNVFAPAILFNRIGGKSYNIYQNKVYEIGLFDIGSVSGNTNKKTLSRLDNTEIALDQIISDGQTATLFGYSEVTDRIYIFTSAYMYTYDRQWQYIEREAMPLVNPTLGNPSLHIFDRYIYYHSTNGHSIRCYDLVEKKEVWFKNVREIEAAVGSGNKTRTFVTDGEIFYLNPDSSGAPGIFGKISPEGIEPFSKYNTDRAVYVYTNGLLGTGWLYSYTYSSLFKTQPYIGASVKFRDTYDKNKNRTFMPSLKHRINR